MGRFAGPFFAISFFCVAACRPANLSTRRPGTQHSNGTQTSDLRMTGMRTQSYGLNGIEWELVTPFGEIFTNKNVMHVKNMNVQLFDNGQKSSDISAEQGFVSTGPKPAKTLLQEKGFPGVTLEEGDMYASGNVVMVSTDGSKLLTDWVHYHKKIDLITSTAPVKVFREDSTTYGIGMEAKPDLSQVHIFNQTLVIPERAQ